ncbi:MAG: hypothetical protein MUP13_03045 [Thermoanaerobaculales bacterium]|nr:hypothetical protein [Thermoanaerobaculales bacterium]
MPRPVHTVAAVSFLNARPLIDGLEREPAISVITDVPSRLLETLTSLRARIALCPVIEQDVVVLLILLGTPAHGGNALGGVTVLVQVRGDGADTRDREVELGHRVARQPHKGGHEASKACVRV